MEPPHLGASFAGIASHAEQRPCAIGQRKPPARTGIATVATRRGRPGARSRAPHSHPRHRSPLEPCEAAWKTRAGVRPLLLLSNQNVHFHVFSSTWCIVVSPLTKISRISHLRVELKLNSTTIYRSGLPGENMHKRTFREQAPICHFIKPLVKGRGGGRCAAPGLRPEAQIRVLWGQLSPIPKEMTP